MVVHTTAAEETEGFGARLARALPLRRGMDHGSDRAVSDRAVSEGTPSGGGDGLFAVVYLTGDLGAGKTTLTRGFLRTLGVAGAVRSPTYTLVEIYEMGMLTVLHLDLYRLADPSELDNLGLREWAGAGHVWLIEWPERGADRLPAADLVVQLTAGADGHDIKVESRSVVGQSWLERVSS